MVFTLICNDPYYFFLSSQIPNLFFPFELVKGLLPLVSRKLFYLPSASLTTFLRLHIFGVENKYLINKNENISLVSIFKILFYIKFNQSKLRILDELSFLFFEVSTAFRAKS